MRILFKLKLKIVEMQLSRIEYFAKPSCILVVKMAPKYNLYVYRQKLVK